MVTKLLPQKALANGNNFVTFVKIVVIWLEILNISYMTAKEVIRLLKKDGWYEKDHKGSHKQFVHPIKKGKVTVPVHSGDIPPGTLSSILKQAGLK
jgi:predicted RNA binding protein YcfA (HicA-like mRNA interferase family)